MCNVHKMTSERQGLRDGQLSPDEVTRYSRHLLLPGVGIPGQERLKAARVAVVGAGGLGSPAVLYLAAAGVGTIGIIDDDVVDVSNLQRQIIHRESDVDQAKVDSTARAVAELNPSVHVERHRVRLSPENALDILSRYDIVIDASDNYSTRYLISDACVLLGKPHVGGAVYQFEGQVSVWWPPEGPCYRCAFPEPPAPGVVPSCAESGVLGAVCGSVGSAQVTEALKLILGIGAPATGWLLVYDALTATWDRLSIPRDPSCAACGASPTIRSLTDVQATCTQVPAEQPLPAAAVLEAEDLAAILSDPPEHFRLIDVRGPEERAVVSIPGAEAIHLSDFENGSALDQLRPDDDVVLYCKVGTRSATALRAVPPGVVARLRHLDGGVLAWVGRVDPRLPTY